jgi:hypothetical protein
MTVADHSRTTTVTAIDYPTVQNSNSPTDAELAAANPAYATLDGISKDSVVLYNIYNTGTTNYKIDYTSIHTAKSADVTVTNTYYAGSIHSALTTNAKSYFLVGSTKYEYSAMYGATINDKSQINDASSATPATYAKSIDELLNRADLVAGRETRQDIYFDDAGFVIYTTPHEGAVASTGYLIARSGTYGQYVADNQYVAGFNVILADGTQTTVQGALLDTSVGTTITSITAFNNATAYYGSMGAANTAAAAVEVGLYAYSVDSNGYYKMIRVDKNLTADQGVSDKVVSNNNILDVRGETTSTIDAGKANSLNTPLSGYALDDNTVFVIANYNDNGIITGYNVVKGFKNVPDLAVGNIDAAVTTGNLSIEAVLCETDADDANVKKTIDLIFIRNAAQKTDSVGTAKADDVIMLVDATPEEQFSTYDRHSVVKSGTKTTLDFVPNGVSSNNVQAGDFFTIVSTSGGYVQTTTPATTVTGVSYRAPGVLSDGNTNFITLANNCVIYKVDSTAGYAVSTIEAKDVPASSTVCVAATDVYGFATVVYVK